MSQPLKVLMMGGRRCGKTSALASLFEQAKNGPINNYFTVADRTILETKGIERQESLSNKTLELTNMLETNKDNSNVFLVDQAPTMNSWLYKLHLQIPGKKREMDIEFRDSAGEFFEASGQHARETEEYVRDCDVFVIVIDTPYLMGPYDEATKEICRESIGLGVNRVKDIQDFLTHITDNDGKDAKMVIFVPLKCEKWAKEPGGLNRVTQRVKEVYATHIKNLSAYSKMNITIMPMLTAGNINFVEFHDAYIYHSIEGPKRCCRIDAEKIRTEFGEIEPLMPGETVTEDSKAVIAGTSLMRPYCWYQITPGDNSYAPRNCDQLPLHIIRFMLAKLIDAQTNEYKGFFGSILKFLRSVFGTMDIDELRDIIGDMQSKGIIKDKGEGIEIIKRF